MKQSLWIKLLRLVIIIATPFFLGLGMILLVIHWDWPSYPEWEYGRIPPDRFGFSAEERLDLAQKTLAYLRQPDPAADVIFMLEDLQISASGEPLYNEREIGHMLDVKNVADGIRFVWLLAGLIVVIGTAAMVLKRDTAYTGWRTVMMGGLFTVLVLLGIALFILLAWDTFFVQFHELLFPPDTWTFAYSDGLIRLFPERFWFDVGVVISVGALLLGLLTAVFGRQMAQSRRI